MASLSWEAREHGPLGGTPLVTLGQTLVKLEQSPATFFSIWKDLEGETFFAAAAVNSDLYSLSCCDF